jgi:hypothetical protein
MKIVVISTARTRSSAFYNVIVQKHPDLRNMFEPYTQKVNKGRRDAAVIPETTNELFQYDDFITKILGQNLTIPVDGQIEDFRFLDYDQIHLLERSDFFGQLCSYQVAWQSRVWNLGEDQSRYDDVKNRKFSIKSSGLRNVINDILGYVRIKRYLIDNQKAFSQYYYENVFAVADLEQSEVKPNNLDYSKIIINYDELKPQFEQAFSKYFNYQTMVCRPNMFYNEVKHLCVE